MKCNQQGCPIQGWLELLLHSPKKIEREHKQYRWDIENCCRQHNLVPKSGWTWSGVGCYYRNSWWKWESSRLHCIRTFENKKRVFLQKLWHKVKQAKTRTTYEKRDDAEKPSLSVRSSSFRTRDFAAFFCAICNQTDSAKNLYPSDSFHATKWNGNVEHNKEVTES